jgi:hypothetical protein
VLSARMESKLIYGKGIKTEHFWVNNEEKIKFITIRLFISILDRMEGAK